MCVCVCVYVCACVCVCVCVCVMEPRKRLSEEVTSVMWVGLESGGAGKGIPLCEMGVSAHWCRVSLTSCVIRCDGLHIRWGHCHGRAEDS